MKSPGRVDGAQLRAELNLTVLEETITALREKLDGFSADLDQLKTTLDENPHWLVETFWQIRNEVQSVRNQYGPEPNLAIANRLEGLVLDLEYCLDRYLEFSRRLPELVNGETDAEFEQLLEFLREAESAYSVLRGVAELAMWNVWIEGSLSTEDAAESIKVYSTKLDAITFRPKSMKLLIRLTHIRIQYQALLKQIEYANDLIKKRTQS